MLFSAAMVRALLNGSKTQTRRVVMARNSLVNGEPPCMKADPEIICAWPNLEFDKAWIDPGPSPAGNPGPYLKVPGSDDSAHRVYSRVQPGDRIWVRETWCEPEPKLVVYRADLTDNELKDERALQRAGHKSDVPWRPSIFMPRWASRITLDVTEVRGQLLQEILTADMLCEGVNPPCVRENFVRLWDSINGKRAGCAWADNPWVWAISFRMVP